MRLIPSILPKDKYIGYTEAPKKGNLISTFLAKLKRENNQLVSYFAAACWELSNPKFVDKTYFENYVKQLTNQLSAKINVEIKD